MKEKVKKVKKSKADSTPKVHMNILLRLNGQEFMEFTEPFIMDAQEPFCTGGLICCYRYHIKLHTVTGDHLIARDDIKDVLRYACS